MATILQNIWPEDAQFLAADFPQYIRVLGTNFPVTVLAFDQTTVENAFFKLQANAYGSGNLTLRWYWTANTATTGDVVLGAQLACITPGVDSQDVTTKAFATTQTVTGSHLGTTARRIMVTTLTITNLDSIANGDNLWLRIYRDAGAGGDTMADDMWWIGGRLEYSDT